MNIPSPVRNEPFSLSPAGHVCRIVFGTNEDRHGNKIAEAEAAEARGIIEQRAAEQFGGYTSYDSQGGWHDPETGQVVVERGFIVELCVEDTDNGTAAVPRFAANAAAQLQQKSVLVIETGISYLVWPRYARFDETSQTATGYR